MNNNVLIKFSQSPGQAIEMLRAITENKKLGPLRDGYHTLAW